MAVCVFYLNDWCPSGMNCKNEHIAYRSLVKTIKCDIEGALKGNQWPLSCFSPFYGGQNVPNFITDQSFEEVRFMCYEKKKQHTLPAYSQKFKQEWTDAKKKMNTMLSLNRKAVINLYNNTTAEQSGENNRSERSEPFAVVAGFGAKQKNKPSFAFAVSNKNPISSFTVPSENQFNFSPMPGNNPFTICTRGSPAPQSDEKKSDTLSMQAAPEKEQQPVAKGPILRFAASNHDKTAENIRKPDGNEEQKCDTSNSNTKLPDITFNSDDFVNKVCVNSNFTLSEPNKNFYFFPVPVNNPFATCTRGSPAHQNNQKTSDTQEKEQQPIAKGPAVFRFAVCNDNKTPENIQGIDKNKEEQKCNSCNSIPKLSDTALNSDDFVNKICASLKSELQIDKLVASVQSLPDKFDSIKLNESPEEIKTLESNEQLKARMESLESQNNNLQYQLRRDNVQINGVKVTPKEDLFEIVKNVAKYIGSEVNEADISNTYRDVRSNLRTSAAPAIIVKFTRTLARDNFMRAYREKSKESINGGGIVATDICNQLGEGRIYVGDHLTPKTALLLREAKKVCKEKNIKFVWVKNGAVLVRKDKNSKAIKINNVNDITTV